MYKVKIMRITAFKDLTRVEQTFFALPFIATTMLLALPYTTFSFRWFCVVPAFMLARISGMAFNQLIDSKIDVRNPRTMHRVIPTGRVTPKQAHWIAWGALFLFVGLCIQINLLTALFALPAAFLLFIYSYMKRVHYICHIFLGLIHFLGPIMTFAALTGTLSVTIFFLGGAAACLIIGNDIAYAIQDYEFDCQNALFSIPSKFGIQKSLDFSVFSQVLCTVMLLGVGLSEHLPPIYYLVLLIVGGLFLLFQRSLRKHLPTFHKIETLFFYCNVGVSFSTLLCVLLSKLWHVML